MLKQAVVDYATFTKEKIGVVLSEVVIRCQYLTPTQLGKQLSVTTKKKKC